MTTLLASLALTVALAGTALAQMPAAAAKASADTASAKTAADTTAPKTTADANAAKTTANSKAKEAGTAAKNALDLNTASESDIAALPDVGAENAKKIVAARPFARKDQLVSKKILSKDAYAKIKDLVIAKQPAKK